VGVFVAATAAVAYGTPAVRSFEFAWLPRALRAYVVPVPDLSTFVLLPFIGLVFAGAAAGALIDGTTSRREEAAAVRRLALAGAALACAAWAASFLPPIIPGTSFWTTSPSYLFIRCGFGAVAVAACYWWLRTSGGGEAKAHAAGAAPPHASGIVSELGRSSLFVYWVHVELVYGLISRPLHGQLPFAASAAGYVLLCAAMWGAVRLKTNAVRRWSARRRTSPAVDAAVS
jgi:hypothetical protein